MAIAQAAKMHTQPYEPTKTSPVEAVFQALNVDRLTLPFTVVKAELLPNGTILATLAEGVRVVVSVAVDEG